MKYNLMLSFEKTENEKTVYYKTEQHTFFYINHVGYYTTKLTDRFHIYYHLQNEIENSIEFTEYTEQTIELTERNKENKKYFIHYRVYPV